MHSNTGHNLVRATGERNWCTWNSVSTIRIKHETKIFNVLRMLITGYLAVFGNCFR